MLEDNPNNSACKKRTLNRLSGSPEKNRNSQSPASKRPHMLLLASSKTSKQTKTDSEQECSIKFLGASSRNEPSRNESNEGDENIAALTANLLSIFQASLYPFNLIYLKGEINDMTSDKPKDEATSKTILSICHYTLKWINIGKERSVDVASMLKYTSTALYEYNNILLKNPTLQAVQLGLLLFQSDVYSMQRPRILGGESNLRALIHVSQLLRLFDDSLSTKDLPQSIRFLRLKLGWNVYIQDRFFSFFNNQHPSIPEYAFNLCPLEEMDNLDIERLEEETGRIGSDRNQIKLGLLLLTVFVKLLRTASTDARPASSGKNHESFKVLKGLLFFRRSDLKTILDTVPNGHLFMDSKDLASVYVCYYAILLFELSRHASSDFLAHAWVYNTFVEAVDCIEQTGLRYVEAFWFSRYSLVLMVEVAVDYRSRIMDKGMQDLWLNELQRFRKTISSNAKVSTNTKFFEATLKAIDDIIRSHLWPFTTE